MVTAIGAGVLDYVFKADIVQRRLAGRPAAVAGMYYTVTNMVTAVVQVVLCGPALTALGVPRSVATLPLTVTGFSLSRC